MYSNRAYGLATSITAGSASSIGTISDFYSDGITPVKINANITFRPGSATSGTYRVVGFLTLARSYDLTTQHVENLVTSTTSTTTATSNFSHAVNFVNPASTEPQWELPIFTAMLLPAGRYSLGAVVENQTGSAATIVVNRVKCYVSN